MKRLFALFISLISIAYAQDSTKIGIATDRGGTSYKINNIELGGRQIDSTIRWKLGSDTMKRITNQWYTQYGGVYGNGVSMTSKINAFNNRSYVNQLIFDYDTTTVITLSGTINLTKGIKVGRSTSFTGTCTINFNGNILDADPDQIIFGPNITVNGLRTRTGEIPARWFGATADGTTNNKAFLDKVQTSALTYKQTVLLTGGSSYYMISPFFTQTVSFKGTGAPVVKYNPSASATQTPMWVIGADSLNLNGIILDGSYKVVTGLEFSNNYKNTLVENCTFTRYDQYDATNVQGILLRNSNDNTTIKYCYFDSINAKINGIARCIRGSGTTGPKNLKILWNSFNSLTNTGAGSSWDNDYVCLQDYQDTLGAEIAYNEFKNVSKRAIKAQSSGIYIHDNIVNSSRWKSGSNSYSVFSVYGNDVRIYNNHINSGSYQNAIDIGAAGSAWKNISVVENTFLLTNAGIGTNDGCRIFGTQNRDIKIIDNYFQNVRTGIWVDCSSRNTLIRGNTVYGATSYSYSTNVTSNSYPENWNYNIKIIDNTAIKGAAAAFILSRLNTAVFSKNTVDSTSSFLFITANTLDSVLRVTAEGNVSSTSTSGNPNIGTYASRISIISNPNAWPGLKFIATDSSNATYMWQGGIWIKIGSSSGSSGGITALTGDVTASGTGSVVSTIAAGAVTNTKVSAGIDAVKIGGGAVNNTEYGYLDGVTSAIQTQINNKVNTSTTITINGTSYDLSAASRSWNVGTVTSVAPGNGMNFSTIAGSGTVTLGTPSTISISSVNGLTTNSHTHTLDLSGRSVSAINGLTGGGNLGSNLSFGLGTPSSVTLSSTNSASGTTHSHAFAPGGTAGQLIRGNGTLSTALPSSGYVKYNIGTNDYTTSNTIPYSDITSAPSVTSGEYIPTLGLEFPSLTSSTIDTAIYDIVDNNVHVGGFITIQTGTITPGLNQTISISLPPSRISAFPSTTWAMGSASAINTTDNTISPVHISSLKNATGQIVFTMIAASNKNYTISFNAIYKYFPGD